MKICSGSIDGRPVHGIAVGETFQDLTATLPDVNDLIAAAIEPDALKEQSAQSSVARSMADLVIGPPIPRPGKIICVGTNYAEHVAESDSVTEAPGHPMLFVRFAESVTGHGQPILRPNNSMSFDYEGELAVVIGRPTRSVPENQALAAIAGYSPFMDGTLRDFQRHTSQFTPGKNFDQSGAWGPFIVTADEVTDPSDLRLTTSVNGEVVQSASTSQLIYGIARIVSYVSSFTTLLPGDVIATGTPGGVGYAKEPPQWLTPGDQVRVEISDVGILENVVADA